MGKAGEATLGRRGKGRLGVTGREAARFPPWAVIPMSHGARGVTVALGFGADCTAGWGPLMDAH